MNENYSFATPAFRNEKKQVCNKLHYFCTWLNVYTARVSRMEKSDTSHHKGKVLLVTIF